jgi:hypothetical protein
MQSSNNISQFEEDYGFICTKFLNQMNALAVCRETTQFALVSSHSEIEKRDFKALSQSLHNESLREIFNNPKDFIAKGGHISLAKSMAASAVVSSVRTIDSASVVFAHSVLEAMLVDLLQLTFKVSPNDWAHFVERRKTELSALINNSIEQIRDSLVSEFIKELERESIMRKSDILHIVCKPTPEDTKMQTYVFSKQELESFDKIRHNLVHGQKFQNKIPDAAKLIEYVYKTGGYFMLLVNQRFGLKFSPSEPGLVERLKKSNPDCDPQGFLLSIASLIHKK